MTLLDTLQLRHKQHKKSVAVLIDPDKADDPSRLLSLINLATENCVDFFFVGGSIVTTGNLSEVVRTIKETVNIPVVLFPGSTLQIDPSADAILFFIPDLRTKSRSAHWAACAGRTNTKK